MIQQLMGLICMYSCKCKIFFSIGATHAAVVSLPFNASMAHYEGKRFCSQLISLREHIAFRKLGMYGKSMHRKQHTTENFDKTLQPTATTPTTISEIDSVMTKTASSENSAATNSIPTITISSENDNIPPATEPDVPMPVVSDVPVVKLKEPSPPPSRYGLYLCFHVCCCYVVLIQAQWL